MSDSAIVLVLSAAGIAFLHTLLGPDHYLPFVALSRAGGWSVRRTVAVTLGCGVGHVLSSVALGGIGIALGVAITRLQWIESARGSAAAWAMLAVGLAYLAWGAKRALRNREHSHWHTHADGTVHCHRHRHHREHLHAHPRGLDRLSPWLLFVVFLLGPCEPLIPLLMVPAARSSLVELVAVVVVFGVVTLATMVGAVLIGVRGSFAIEVPALQRWGHALAGSVIVLAASGMLFLGL